MDFRLANGSDDHSPAFSFDHLLRLFEPTLVKWIAKLRPAATLIYGLRRRLGTVSVMALTLWLFAHVMFGANGMVIYQAKRAELHSLQKEINSLQVENDVYGKQIDHLKSDPATIEREAREQLHYTRPGEVVYISPNNASQDDQRIRSAKK